MYECRFSQQSIIQLPWGGDLNELNGMKVAKAVKTLESLPITLYKYLSCTMTKEKNSTIYKGTTRAVVQSYNSTIVQKYNSISCNTIISC